MPSNQETTAQKKIVCIHCNREFKNFKALCSHLKGCKERKLHRQFEVNGFLFDVTMNPLKRHVTALRSFRDDLKGANPEKTFVGALLYMKKAGFIHDFTIGKVKPAGSASGPGPAPTPARAGAGTQKG